MDLSLDSANLGVLSIDVVASAPWVALVRIFVSLFDQVVDFEQTSGDLVVNLFESELPVVSE